MRNLRKFLRLSWADRGLLLAACALVGAIRLGLLVFPVKDVRRMLAPISTMPPRSRQTGAHTLDQIAWAVTVASELVPGAACLTQALAAQVLVERAGLQSRLQIGVARGKADGLEAHAWLESKGRVVVGGSGVERYAPLLPGRTLDGEAELTTRTGVGKIETLPGAK
jgi:hypothetical protein